MDVREKFARKFCDPARLSDRQLQVLALLTALAANLAFWGLLFGHRATDASVRENRASIELLRIAQVRDAGFGNFERWLAFNDPANFGSSAYPGGYTAQLPADLKIVAPPADRPATVSEPPKPVLPPFTPEKIADATCGFAFPVLIPPAVPRFERAALTVFDERGRVIPTAAPAELPRSGGMVVGDTVLVRTGSSDFPVFVLRDSCGDPGLDRFAAGLIPGDAAKLDPPPEYIYVRWPGEAAAGKETRK